MAILLCHGILKPNEKVTWEGDLPQRGQRLHRVVLRNSSKEPAEFYLYQEQDKNDQWRDGTFVYTNSLDDDKWPNSMKYEHIMEDELNILGFRCWHERDPQFMLTKHIETDFDLDDISKAEALIKALG